ncbi:hypothetical protein MC885_004685 [Smutsia gigantea]|nr:hypothetical protein MC885_004685 [Smutsia gigantea]
MFITVMFGAGCRELLNPWCTLVTHTAHLRQRGRYLQMQPSPSCLRMDTW